MVIPRNTVLPATASSHFTTRFDNQLDVAFPVRGGGVGWECGGVVGSHAITSEGTVALAPCAVTRRLSAAPLPAWIFIFKSSPPTPTHHPHFRAWAGVPRGEPKHQGQLLAGLLFPPERSPSPQGRPHLPRHLCCGRGRHHARFSEGRGNQGQCRHRHHPAGRSHVAGGDPAQARRGGRV